MATRAPEDEIRVLNVWYDVPTEVGQTIMRCHGHIRPRALGSAAITAAHAEILARLPIGVLEPVVTLRLRRGPRLRNGDRHAYVDWRVGYPRPRLLRAVEFMRLRVCLLFSRRR